MAFNTTNDAAQLAGETQLLCAAMKDLYWKAKSHRGNVVALGITWDGNTAGVPQDAAVGNGENQLNALIALVEQPGVLTVLLQAAKIGG